MNQDTKTQNQRLLSTNTQMHLREVRLILNYKVCGTKALQYISIYVYMIMVSRKEKVGIGKGRIGDKLKGTSRPSNKFPIGEYICRIDRIDSLFYKNFLPDFSTRFFYVDFLLQFSTRETSGIFSTRGSLQNLC